MIKLPCKYGQFRKLVNLAQNVKITILMNLGCPRLDFCFWFDENTYLNTSPWLYTVTKNAFYCGQNIILLKNATLLAIRQHFHRHYV